jgi:hypothetical protein
VKYMCLIYASDVELTESESAQLMPAYVSYTKMLMESGAMVAGDPLDEPSSATTVRVRDGKRAITDGPFVETKEYLGGYYILDVPNLDVALDLAAQCPGAAFGTIEVRPLMDMSAVMNAG